jgi:hypothetical protein
VRSKARDPALRTLLCGLWGDFRKAIHAQVSTANKPGTCISNEYSKNHRTRHIRPYKCPELDCNYHTIGFGKRNDLERHQSSRHPSQERVVYTCPHRCCPLFLTGFPRKDNCKRHIEEQHSDLPYQPPQIFIRRQVLSSNTILQK